MTDHELIELALNKRRRRTSVAVTNDGSIITDFGPHKGRREANTQWFFTPEGVLEGTTRPIRAWWLTRGWRHGA